MPLPFKELLIAKRKWLYGILAGTTVLVLLAGLFLFRLQRVYSEPEQRQPENPAVEFGLIYLPVTQYVSACYHLGVTSGALVTDITKGSLFEQAGIRNGDVIVSFNGARVEDDTPLLGMMRTWCVGQKVTLEIWNQNGTRVVEITPAER